MHSAESYKIAPTVLGFGQKWQGGSDIKNKPGGGWKINLLKTAIEPYKDDPNKIILFTDGYDVVFLTNIAEITEKFKATKAKILFGAEKFCWPDVKLAEKYPEVSEGNRFLNSGLFMGYTTEIWQLLNHEVVSNEDDDQLFFTKAYLNEILREKLAFQLDHKSQIFQNLNGAINEVHVVEVKPKEGAESYRIENVIYHSRPAIIHGNGGSKITLNSLGNYLGNNWNSVDGCVACKKGHIDLTDKKISEMPLVLIAVFIELNTPFLEEQLRKVYKQDYPKERIHLFIHNSVI